MVDNMSGTVDCSASLLTRVDALEKKDDRRSVKESFCCASPPLAVVLCDPRYVKLPAVSSRKYRRFQSLAMNEFVERLSRYPS